MPIMLTLRLAKIPISGVGVGFGYKEMLFKQKIYSKVRVSSKLKMLLSPALVNQPLS